jgi:hypothetical protein
VSSVIACQNCAVYSVLPSGMTSHFMRRFTEVADCMLAQRISFDRTWEFPNLTLQGLSWRQKQRWANPVKPLPSDVAAKIHHLVLLGSTVRHLTVHVNWQLAVGSNKFCSGKDDTMPGLCCGRKKIFWSYLCKLIPGCLCSSLHQRRVNWGEKKNWGWEM